MPPPVWSAESFLDLLRRLIALGPELQNAPEAGLVPREELAADVVLERLARPIAAGQLRVQRLAAEGFASRPSLVITLPGCGDGQVSFVGSHFDVVPADRVHEGWSHDPFQLAVKDDGTLVGRGVTDCLGNVAVLTELLAALCARELPPRRTVSVVLIANEESVRRPEIGLDYVLSCGALEPLRAGPVFWLDSTDFGPTVGTGGVTRWDLTASGVAGHSGMPHNCVNALELAMAASRALGAFFAARCPPHPEEQRYGFPGASSLKATVAEVPNKKFTTIPGTARISGDLRLTPFYDMREVIESLAGFVADLDARLDRGEAPAGFPRVRAADGRRGRVELSVTKEGYLEGLACDLESAGLAALERAMREVRGPEGAQRSAMTAALPLVRDLQRQGFDVQITGFGVGPAMHAPDEHGRLRDFEQGFAILGRVVDAE